MSTDNLLRIPDCNFIIFLFLVVDYNRRRRRGTPYLLGSRLLPKQSGGRKPNLARDAVSELDSTWISIQTYFDLREGSTSYFYEI